MAEKKLRIFLSYAHEQKLTARKIYAALTEAGHKVFFDSESLRIGKEFHLKIINEIKTSDLVIFLISPDSVQKGSFARSELRIAKESKRLIFPVMTVETDYSLIPSHIDATTIFNPEGDIAFEITEKIYSSILKPEDKTIDENLDELRKADSTFNKNQRLKEIDDEWEERLKSYNININGRDVNFSPTPAIIVIPLIGGAIMSVFFLFLTSEFEGNNFFAIFPLALGGIAAFINYRNMKKFEKEQEDYFARRASIDSDEAHSQNQYKILNL